MYVCMYVCMHRSECDGQHVASVLHGLHTAVLVHLHTYIHTYMHPLRRVNPPWHHRPTSQVLRVPSQDPEARMDEPIVFAFIMRSNTPIKLPTDIDICTYVCMCMSVNRRSRRKRGRRRGPRGPRAPPTAARTAETTRRSAHTYITYIQYGAHDVCMVCTWKGSIAPAHTTSPLRSHATQLSCASAGVVRVRKFLYLSQEFHVQRLTASYIHTYIHH